MTTIACRLLQGTLMRETQCTDTRRPHSRRSLNPCTRARLATATATRTLPCAAVCCRSVAAHTHCVLSREHSCAAACSCRHRVMLFLPIAALQALHLDTRRGRLRPDRRCEPHVGAAVLLVIPSAGDSLRMISLATPYSTPQLYFFVTLSGAELHCSDVRVHNDDILNFSRH